MCPRTPVGSGNMYRKTARQRSAAQRRQFVRAGGKRSEMPFKAWGGPRPSINQVLDERAVVREKAG
jgi:hypothetical protein